MYVLGSPDSIALVISVNLFELKEGEGNEIKGQ
jgi:hypothetical protein